MPNPTKYLVNSIARMMVTTFLKELQVGDVVKITTDPKAAEDLETYNNFYERKNLTLKAVTKIGDDEEAWHILPEEDLQILE